MLPSTVACLPRTHPSLVFLTGASAAGPERTHGEESGTGWEEAKLRPLPGRGGGSFSAQSLCNRKYLYSFSGGLCPLLPQRCLRSRWHRSTSLVPPRGTAPSHEIFPGYSGAPYPFWAQQLPLPRALIHTRLCRSAQNPLAQSFLDFSHFPTHQHHLCDH